MNLKDAILSSSLFVILFAVVVSSTVMAVQDTGASYPDCAPATINIYTNGREFCFAVPSVRGSATLLSNTRFETKAAAIEVAWIYYERERFSIKSKPDRPITGRRIGLACPKLLREPRRHARGGERSHH